MPRVSPVAVLLTLVAAPLTPALLAGQETPTERSAAAGVIRRMNDLERSRSFMRRDRKSTRLNSSHSQISYAVFCLKKKKMMIGNDNGVPLWLMETIQTDYYIKNA